MISVALLWFLDELLTLRDTHKYGLISEQNPIMKYFLRKGKAYLIGFKITSFLTFAFLNTVIYSINKYLAYIIAIFIIAVYILIDVNNYQLLFSED